MGSFDLNLSSGWKSYLIAQLRWIVLTAILPLNRLFSSKNRNRSGLQLHLSPPLTSDKRIREEESWIQIDGTGNGNIVVVRKDFQSLACIPQVSQPGSLSELSIWKLGKGKGSELVAVALEGHCFRFKG